MIFTKNKPKIGDTRFVKRFHLIPRSYVIDDQYTLLWCEPAKIEQIYRQTFCRHTGVEMGGKWGDFNIQYE